MFTIRHKCRQYHRAESRELKWKVARVKNIDDTSSFEEQYNIKTQLIGQ